MKNHVLKSHFLQLRADRVFLNIMHDFVDYLGFQFLELNLVQPWILKGKEAGRPLVRIMGKQRSYEVFAQVRSLLPYLLSKEEMAILNAKFNRFLVISVKGKVAAEHKVQSYSNSPYIAFKIIRTFEHFGALVRERGYNFT